MAEFGYKVVTARGNELASWAYESLSPDVVVTYKVGEWAKGFCNSPLFYHATFGDAQAQAAGWPGAQVWKCQVEDTFVPNAILFLGSITPGKVERFWGGGRVDPLAIIQNPRGLWCAMRLKLIERVD